MKRLFALLRPPPKRPQPAGQSVPRGARARLGRAARTVAIFLRPRWIAFHLLVWGLAVVMVLLGRWQLDVSNSRHFDLQNFSYSLQWWAFSAFGLFLWVRVMQYHLRPPTPPSSGTGLVLATSGGLSPVGPAELVASGGAPGQEPVVYRGYVMPQSSDRLVRSHGDTYHDNYNDYLWQLALADGSAPSPPMSAGSAGSAHRRPPADDRPGRAIEAPPDSDS